MLDISMKAMTAIATSFEKDEDGLKCRMYGEKINKVDLVCKRQNKNVGP